MGTLKPQSNGPLYSSTVIGTLQAVDGWAVTFDTARRGLGGEGWGPAQSPPRCTKCNSSPTNGLQCTNFILFDVALIATVPSLSRFVVTDRPTLF